MRDYEENLEKYLGQIKKFTKEIIFKNQEIKHDIHIPSSNGIPRILFQIYVDIDKMYKGSPTYDKKYQGIIKQLDFEIPISISNSYLLVPEKRLVGGRWNIEVSWMYKNKAYLIKEKISY